MGGGSPEAQRSSGPVARVGFWSAGLSAAFATFYIVAQLAEWAGWLGSAGGPMATSTPLAIGLLLTPSLLLASAFVVLMVSVHQAAAPEARIWTHIAIVFAVMYAVLVSLVYYVQLTYVGPHLAAGMAEEVSVFLFEPFDSFLYAVDILGYTFMSVSTLFAANASPGQGIARWARWSLRANGLLIPFLALQMYVPSLIYGAALWAITFPAATISLALLFKEEM